MNEKSIMPLNSYSAYSPPFRYSAFIELQIDFSRQCQNRLSVKKSPTTNNDEVFSTRISIENSSPDQWKQNKKQLVPKQYVFGRDYEELPINKTTIVGKSKRKKGLSLIESIIKPETEAPELLIFKSPTNILNRYISPCAREHKEPKQSVKEIPKLPKENTSNFKKSTLRFPILVEDDLKKLKEFLFEYFMKALRVSNGFSVIQGELKSYKFYVGPGNNSELVIKVIRSRPWWSRIDSAREAHFVWTATKHKKTIKKLPGGTRLKLEHLEHETKRMAIKQSIEIEKNGYGAITHSKFYASLVESNPIILNVTKVHNRLEYNKHLCSKKKLFQNLKVFYESTQQKPFEFLPLTFHIKSGESDVSFKQFQIAYQEILHAKSERTWIVKPGENTNRGKGIKISNSLPEIKSIICSRKEGRTYIIQKYIENPLLINKRKFDIRCFGLITSFNTTIQGYFYPEGYIRTSSKEFSIKSLNKYIHLTNDAIQKKSEEYGKFEAGNKVSYSEFQEYLDQEFPQHHINFEKDINSQIRKIISDTFIASHEIIDPNRRMHTFELLGYDFMVDQDFKVWLIEVNTNPCLELSCSYLSRLIPAVLDNALRITIDQIFAPNSSHKKYQSWISDGIIGNKFELIFSENKYREIYNK